MRDILFRGKPTKEVLENESLLKTLPIKDGFVYGNLIYNDKQPYIVGPIADANDEYCSMEWWCPVEPDTVGQFTGLLDKNGKKIFEGDIIKTPYNDVYDFATYSVVFRDGAWSGKIISMHHKENGFKDISRGGYCETAHINQVYAKDTEVIGNIHDNNPELLDA